MTFTRELSMLFGVLYLYIVCPLNFKWCHTFALSNYDSR